MNTKEWLVCNSRFLRISVIEVEVGCPKYTLTKFISGERVLPEKWVLPMEEIVKKIVDGYDVRDEIPLPELKDKQKTTEINVQQNTSIISEDGKDVINSLPEIFDQKQGYKNMKRVEPNINYNGEIYEVYVYKEGKFEYCYCDNIDKARFILQSLKNK